MVPTWQWLRPRRLLGARLAVVLTFLAAVLSVVTGIANIGPGTTPSGPLTAYLPELVIRTAGFTGTLTGFLLLGAALALRKRLRTAWYVAAVLLPVTASQGLLQASELSYPLVVVSLAALVVVLLNYRRFGRKTAVTTTQLAAGTALVGAMLYGTVGAYALRGEFNGIETLTDAFYFTLVTGSTVGYGDVTPTTTAARLFGMSVLLVSVSSFAVALGVLLTPAIEARLTKALGRMTESQLELLQNHVLVLGYGELTEPILGELRESDVEFIVITPDQAKATELSERGFKVLTADPSSEEPLRRAQIEDARAVVVATNDDAEDALSVLTARQLRPDVRIVVAATDRENVDKLRRAGADTVISPASIGGHLLVKSALGANDTEAVADKILEDETELAPEMPSEDE
jgi:voltage-gated potassium channel